MEAKAYKTAMADPLQQLGVLQLVMCFVGQKEYLYMSLVNSTWSAEYQVMVLTMPCEHSFHASRCTSYAAIFPSVSRLQLSVCDSAGLYLRHRFHLRGDGRVERAAGKYASIETIKTAVGLGLELTCNVTQGAIESRDLDKLRWLHTEQQCPLPQDATLIAAKAKSVGVLRWLQESGCEFNEHTSYEAARMANNIEVLKLLYDSGCTINKYVCNAAVAPGDLEQLQWLHARGASLATVAAFEVSLGASVPVVHWLLDQGLIEGVISESTMELAASAGSVDLCRRLLCLDCPWDVRIIAAAARHGHCDTLRFLHEQECPWDEQAFSNALKSKPFACADPLSVLQYLTELYIFTDKQCWSSLLEWAGSANELSVAVWLRQQGAEWPCEPETDGITYWHAEMIAWAMAEGCAAPTTAASEEVKYTACIYFFMHILLCTYIVLRKG
jgi:hypothetical protein